MFATIQWYQKLVNGKIQHPVYDADIPYSIDTKGYAMYQTSQFPNPLTSERCLSSKDDSFFNDRFFHENMEYGHR